VEEEGGGSRRAARAGEEEGGGQGRVGAQGAGRRMGAARLGTMATAAMGTVERGRESTATGRARESRALGTRADGEERGRGKGREGRGPKVSLAMELSAGDAFGFYPQDPGQARQGPGPRRPGCTSWPPRSRTGTCWRSSARCTTFSRRRRWRRSAGPPWSLGIDITGRGVRRGQGVAHF